MSSSQLQKDAALGVDLLQKVTSRTADRKTGGEGPPVMSPLVVKFSKAVGFMVQRKAIVGVGFTYGSGFVVSRLDDGRWSAPSYFTTKDVSIGASIAAKEVQSVIAFRDATAVEQFTVGEFSLGSDMMVTLGSRPDFEVDVLPTSTPQLHAQSAMQIWGTDQVGVAATFSVADGVGLDFSVKAGVVSLDKKSNESLFGTADGKAILGGSVAPPAEFEPLYALLNKLAAA